MLLAGLWHGASWIFVLWGAYHGALLIAYHFPPLNLLAGKEERFSWRTLVAVPLMWLLILVGWAIFRSADLSQLWSLVRGPGPLANLPGPALEVFLRLAVDPHRALDFVAALDLEISP